MASAANTMVRCASMASRVWWNIGRAARRRPCHHTRLVTLVTPPLGGSRLRDPGSDDEPQPRLVQLAQVARRQHAGVGDHHVCDAVPGLELLHDRQDRQCLGLVALEQPISSGNPWRSTSRPTTICGSTRWGVARTGRPRADLVLSDEEREGSLMTHGPAGVRR
jgi:hypothetical protein